MVAKGLKEITPQLRWMVLNPDGIIRGPCAETKEEVIYVLEQTASNLTNKVVNWDQIQKWGYQVIECWIHPLHKT